MALKNQPEFEQESTTTATTTTKEQGSAVDENVKAAADVAATVAVAKAGASSAVSTNVNKKLIVAFSGHKDVFETATVSALSQATPRITAEQGALKKDRTTKIGTKAVVEVVSWNLRWALGCGEDKMNDEMKALFRVSYDNKTVDGEGGSIEEYINSLKAQGYAKAKVSPYADLFGYIVSQDGKDIPVDERELVLFQLSATSLGNFTAFCVSRGLLESRGMVAPSDLIEVTAEDRTKGDKSFTNMSFKVVK